MKSRADKLQVGRVYEHCAFLSCCLWTFPDLLKAQPIYKLHTGDLFLYLGSSPKTPKDPIVTSFYLHVLGPRGPGWLFVSPDQKFGVP